ncbi:MAG TPA: tetratricopeptide repeat protein [Campylobacterales bacterium]|nr:tetratricopeptide repeat protein [Campylobacterales bacterium]
MAEEILDKELGELDEQIILKEDELLNKKNKKGDRGEKDEETENITTTSKIPVLPKVPKLGLSQPTQIFQNLKNILIEKKEKIVYGILYLLVTGGILFLLSLFWEHGNDDIVQIETNGTDELETYTEMALQEPSTLPKRQSQVEELIKKANLLYQQGQKHEALRLYGRIATYNASLSYYNLGVARAKKGLCKEAIRAFDRAIQNREHITPSAINAAVCSKKLGDNEKVKAYLDLAYKYLPDELDSPLYSYYYSLISFYRGNYFETLSSLNHQTSNYFQDEKNMMESRIQLLFENYGDSATALEKALTNEDIGNLGLIYANMGELDMAKKNIEKAIENNSSSSDELMRLKYAHALIDLKLGNVKDAGNQISALNDGYGEKLNNTYDLELSLKESLFDVQKAQNFFNKEQQFVKYNNYQILFYFAPYKIFDAKKSINLIKKGSATTTLGDSDEGLHILGMGAKSSDVNKNIVLAVKEVLNKRLRIANKILRELEKENPKHAVLHYDLGLTYAQLGDMVEAYKHFKRSWHLNSRDYISGIFALLSGSLIGADIQKLEEVFRENLSLEREGNEKQFYEMLLNLKHGNLHALQNWLEGKPQYENDLFKLGTVYLITTLLEKFGGNSEINRHVSKLMLRKLPDDILVHLLYLYSNFKDLDIKEFSREIIRHFQLNHLPLSDFYHGARVVQEFYIKFHLLTGKLEELERKLKYYYSVELQDPEGVAQALALTMLYNKHFEESYQLYNKIIDEYGAKDSRTLFLAGISAVASKHYANGVALFELAKLKNKINYETRYGLGLLYLQTKNFEAAGIQFKLFEDKEFFSDFFDFNVKSVEKIESFYKNGR